MGKQDEYRFNLKFDETDEDCNNKDIDLDDEDHRRVSEFLNSCGRKKTRYIVKAILAYWALQEGRNPVLNKPKEERTGKKENRLMNTETDIRKDRLIQVDSGRSEEMDQEEDHEEPASSLRCTRRRRN